MEEETNEQNYINVLTQRNRKPHCSHCKIFNKIR